MSKYTPENLITWLQKAIDKINDLEGQGQKAVTKGDEAGYMAIMRDKATVLAALDDEAQPFLDEIDNEDALDYAARSLAAYSSNANQALELDSVFYMSALLFSDDHKAGEPNNLELFRDELIKKLGF